MPKKIAVLRANALGDFIFILPALTALKETFPDAEIVLLAKKMHKALLANRPSPVDRVVIVPPYAGVGEAENFVGDEAQIAAFFESMKQEQFDIAIQMHGGGRNSNPFVRQLGAKLTIGLQATDAPALDINIPYTVYFNEVLRYLEVVSYVGAKTVNMAPLLTVTDYDKREAAQVINNSLSKPIVVIQPGATDPRRRWPVENFSRVADTLAAKGFFICFNGVEEEKYLAEQIIKSITNKDSCQNLSGELSLGALIGLLSQSKLMISNDTGPLHVAHALCTPAVGIYWAPNMVTSAPITSSLARPLVAWNTNCPLCGAGFYTVRDIRKECDHNTSFVSAITVEEVIASALELLGLRARNLQAVESTLY